MDVPGNATMKTLIRSDSSSTIGTGHILRDLVLAKRLGGDIIFACIPYEGNLIDFIPYEVVSLSSNDIEELITLIQTRQFERVVFDHYDIDETFERTVKEATGVQILSLDDMYRSHHCDILLNHNLYAEKEPYRELVPKDCQLWCGEEYLLIRDEFVHEKAMKREKKYDLLIAMGGADNANLTLKIAQQHASLSAIAILTTTANAHLDALKNYAVDHPHIHLLINSNQTAQIMNESRYAILTPSTIAQEAVYMNLPFEAIQTASNQADMVTYLKNHGYTVREQTL